MLALARLDAAVAAGLGECEVGGRRDQRDREAACRQTAEDGGRTGSEVRHAGPGKHMTCRGECMSDTPCVRGNRRDAPFETVRSAFRTVGVLTPATDALTA